MKKILMFCFGVLWSGQCMASVWVSEQSWDESWQRNYQQWIRQSVGPNFFKELGGVYATLKIDCADAHYALKAYFSYIHKLNYSAAGGLITEKTSRFDHIAGGDQRLAAFINYLSANLGTESLAHQDTYPVAIKNVGPGDIFTYKVGSNGNYTRHAYIIKNVNIDGTFDVMYSTQARRDKGLPLNRHATYMFTKAPLNTGGDRNHWGFRRSKLPQHNHIAQESLNFADFSQYTLAERVGRLQFFREVKRIHQTVLESANMSVQRNFNTVCSAVKDRVDVIKSGVDFVKRVGGRCLNEQEYDAYSTPSRDSGIMDNYRNYLADLQNIQGASRVNEVDPKFWNLSAAIFSDQNLTRAQTQNLMQVCRIQTRVADVDLGSFKRNLFAGQVSYHPNDSEPLRWGLSSSGKTRCHEYYGYPQ